MKLLNIFRKLKFNNRCRFRTRNCSTVTLSEQPLRYLINLNAPEIKLDDVKQVILESGISLAHFRISECMRILEDTSTDSVIERNKFLELLEKKEFHLFHKVMTDSLAIPNFRHFTDQIQEIYTHCIGNNEGAVSTNTPQLSKVDPKYWGVSLCTVDGQRFSVGDTQVNFCLQSTSKAINYALALTEVGSYGVHQYVGYEPSGMSFNHIHLNSENKPHNPMINAGAILVCSLIMKHLDIPERFDYIYRQFKRICGYETLNFNNSVFMSKKSSADRNFALAYYMREKGCFPKNSNLHEILDLYFQLCSLETNCDSMSIIAATFANGGLCPTTQEKVLTSEAVRDTLCLMHSCGMYDNSGQFAFKCGLPCKSGISGSCLLVVPNLMGISLWSPLLDKQGNSARSIQFCKEMVQKFNFHHFDSLLDHHNKIDPRKHRSVREENQTGGLISSDL